MSGQPAILLVAHGSRDPRAAQVVRRLVAQVGAEQPGRRVSAAYLDFTAPTVGEALRELVEAGESDVVAVPLLFAPGYHLRVDLPSAIAEVRAGCPQLRVAVAEPLGAAPAAGRPDRLVEALSARLADAGATDAGGSNEADGADAADAIVLASAGSSDPLARAAVEAVAARWSAQRDIPVRSAYVTGPGPNVEESVAQLRHEGHVAVATSGLFVAPGRLPEAAARSAREAGAVVVADPIGSHPGLVRLILDRSSAHESLFAAAR